MEVHTLKRPSLTTLVPNPTARRVAIACIVGFLGVILFDTLFSINGWNSDYATRFGLHIWMLDTISKQVQEWIFYATFLCPFIIWPATKGNILRRAWDMAVLSVLALVPFAMVEGLTGAFIERAEHPARYETPLFSHLVDGLMESISGTVMLIAYFELCIVLPFFVALALVGYSLTLKPEGDTK